MGIGNVEIGNYSQISATGNVVPNSTTGGTGGALLGIFVSSTTSGALTIYDSKTTLTTDPKILDTIIFTNVGWYALPVAYTKGLYCVVGGTLSATVVWL